MAIGIAPRDGLARATPSQSEKNYPSHVAFVHIKEMKPILSEDHFINYINFMLRKYQREDINLLLREDYVRLIYNEGLATIFADDLRHDLTILDANKIQKWIDEYPFGLKNNQPTLLDIYGKEANFTNQFIDFCELLLDVPGVYNFWDKTINQPLYIGKSNNLGGRIINSYAGKKEYFSSLPIKASCIKTTYADASVYELYFINLWKPLLNKKDKAKDEIQLTISPMPEFSEGVLVIGEITS